MIDTSAVTPDLAARFVATIERRRLPLVALFTATGASLLGRQLATVAIPAAVYTATGSIIQAGLTATCLVFPWLLTNPEGGALTGRIDPKLTSIATGVFGAAMALAMPLFDLPAMLPISSLLLLSVMFACVTAHGSVARHSMVPEAAARAGWSSDLADRAMRWISRAAIVAGVLLAPLGVMQLGEVPVLAVSAALIAFAAAADVTLAIPARPDRYQGRSLLPRLSAMLSPQARRTAGTLDQP